MWRESRQLFSSGWRSNDYLSSGPEERTGTKEYGHPNEINYCVFLRFQLTGCLVWSNGHPNDGTAPHTDELDRNILV